MYLCIMAIHHSTRFSSKYCQQHCEQQRSLLLPLHLIIEVAAGKGKESGCVHSDISRTVSLINADPFPLIPASLPVLLFEAAENPYKFTIVHSHPEILLVFHETFGTLTVSSSTCHVPLSHQAPKQSHCQGSQGPGFSWTAGASLGAARARNPSALCRVLITE